MDKTTYRPLKEKIKSEPETKEDHVRDYITNQIVKSGVPEHREAVNIFAQRLVEELDYSKEQIQTTPQFRVKVSPSGQEKYPVDMVVFRDKNKTHDNVYMLVECKQPTRRDGRKQLDIYLNLVPSVDFGVWFNGKEHLYLWKIQDPKNKRWIWREIPELPKKGQRVEDIGLYKRKDLERPVELRSKFNDIRNYLAGNAVGITNDIDFAQQIINLLFCKIYDEIQTARNEQVKFRVGIDESSEDVKKRITELFNKVKEEYNDVFDEGDVIKLDENSIVYVVGELQRYAITESERDAIGDAFEVFIGPALRGAEGQFFTPRNVVRLAIEILGPGIGEYIIDPACGSGGFLIIALEYVWQKLDEEARKKDWSTEFLAGKKKELASKFIAGIDKDSFLAKVTKAYMAIIGDGRGGIFCENTLLPPSEWSQKTRQKIDLENFDVLITNPPFGVKIPVHGDRVLQQYNLGFKWKFDKETKQWERTNRLHDKQPPQILFIERCLQLLRPGGRMGIVLPETYLHAKNSEHILHFLQQYKILHVLDLSHDTFRPQNNAKTVVVFLEKSKPQKDHKIFFSIARKVGHDHTGRTLYKIDFQKNQRTNEIDDDIPLIINKLRGFRMSQRLTPSPLLFSQKYKDINPKVLVPRYYWRNYLNEIKKYAQKNKSSLIPFGELYEKSIISVCDGHGSPDAVFKGKGEIPYIRVADIVNLEAYKNPTALIPYDVYLRKKGKGVNLQVGDLLFVRRGSYRIGSVALISPFDIEILLTKEILVFRIIKKDNKFGITPYYLLYLLNLPVVQRQIDDKVLIETTLPNIADRWQELLLPIHDNIQDRMKISKRVQNAFELKWKATEELKLLKEGKV